MNASIFSSVNDLWNSARGDNSRSMPNTSFSRRFTKPIKLPDDYDGRTCLRDYLRHFDRCAVINGWKSEESAFFFSLQPFVEKHKKYYMGCPTLIAMITRS